MKYLNPRFKALSNFLNYALDTPSYESLDLFY